MFNNVALDVVIGLVFIFLLYSLLASIIQEVIATKLAFRSKILEKGILRMLEDGKTTTSLPLWDSLKGFYQLIFRSNNLKNKRFATAFYTHPLLKYLAEDNWFSKPDYISAKNFSKTMIDLLHGIESDFRGINILRIKQSIESGKLNIGLEATDKDNPANQTYIKQIQTNPNAIDINPETKLFLQSLLAESKGDVEKFKLLLENWFDDTMQRTTGWYKRYTQYILVIVGFILAFSFNVDSIAIAKILAKDDKARDQIVQMAVTSAEKYRLVTDSRRPGNANDSPNTMTDGNDTILNETYQLIMEDANKASKVLGLGRPWKDSCKICGDSLKNDSFKIRLNGAITSTINLEFDKIESLRLDGLIKQRREDSTTTKPVKDSLLKLLLLLKADHDTLVKNHNKIIAEQQRLVRFSERCAYIKEARNGKWNKYSPNQEGGWETFIGWLITALAISLGAPFWFDLLSKLIKVRGSGGLKKESSEAAVPVSPASVPAQTINVNTNPGEEAVG